MNDVMQELMTPPEAAKWFRRSVSWLRKQDDLLRLGGKGGQPLYHVHACRAYLLGQSRGLKGPPMIELQMQALATASGLEKAK